ncbi:MAG: hypothetical protein RDV41_14160, partial [Planctomycetota bacterium]|nr:hypothetical protein [Planctomycetota bacterium]
LTSSTTTTTENEEGGEETKKEDTPLDGKTLVIERTDDPDEPLDVKVEGDKEGLPEDLTKLVTLDEGPVHLLPGKEVAVGETWNPSEDAIKKYFSGSLQGSGEAMPNMKIASISGTAECKLKEVVEETGKNRAVVAFKMDLEVELDPKAMLGGAGDSEGEEDSPTKDMSGEMSMNVKLTGEFDLGLEEGKLARHEFSGSFSFEMSTEQSFEGVGTAETSMKGKGNMERSETWKVSKEE